MICKNCGKDFNPNSLKTRVRFGFCSHKCSDTWDKWNKEPNCKCEICGKEFYMRPSHKRKLIKGATCSRDCSAKFKAQYFSGENNHQYGLKGHLNSSYKGAELTCKNHNNVDIYVYAPNHPYANKDGRVLKHRLVVEENYQRFNTDYFEVINHKIVLKKVYQVHHKDGNHNNNNIDNLIILNRSEHTALHNLEKVIIRNPKNGRITGIVKRCELLETPEVDNQQPSLSSNTLEGSETNSRVLPDNAEDSNADTSAVPCRNTSDDIVRPTDITLK